MSTTTVHPRSAGNIEHIQAWVDLLHATSKQQCKGALAYIMDLDSNDEPIFSYCCLGLGAEHAGVKPTPVADESGKDLTWPEMFDETAKPMFGDETGLAPYEFVEWLDVTGESGADGFDVLIDWPEGLTGPHNTIPYRFNVSCSVLNDTLSLSFSQIGDVVAYFGLRDADNS